MSNKSKKLVIGLMGIREADRSVDWLEPMPLIGDFHDTYIYLPSLTQDVIEKIDEINPEFFEKLKNDIFDALKAAFKLGKLWKAKI